jgi:hypothetical protein
MTELESSKNCHVDCQVWPCMVVVPALLLFLIVPVMETASRRSVKGALGGWKRTVVTSINRSFLACLTCLGLFCGVQLEARGPLTATAVSKPVLVSDPPETRSPVSLKAINDPHTGKAAFSFDGREDPPVIRANAGEEIHLTYTNAMSTHSQEHCVSADFTTSEWSITRTKCTPSTFIRFTFSPMPRTGRVFHVLSGWIRWRYPSKEAPI